MDLKKIEKILKDANQPKYRLEQVKKAVYQDSSISFSEITTFSKELREKLEKETKILSFEVEKVLVSKDKDSIKALLKLNDGKYIESVIIFSKVDNWTVCLSCQVGCPLKCSFCATGQSGFQRNLSAEEITDQILFWRHYLKKFKISNLKFKIEDENLSQNEITDEYKEWEKERENICLLGGLHVIGTERHEARRIDDQLRGRAGRQGDPGSSQFFVSTDDDVIRIFGGEEFFFFYFP